MGGVLGTHFSPPVVTVVVISYNHGAYLKACLEAVLAQSYAHIQCIVIDNASSDGSPEAIRAIADRVPPGGTLSIEPILSETNAHLTGAMVQGLARAKGAYIVFVDGDDYLLPHCIEAHVQAHLVSRVPVGATSVDLFQSRGTQLVVGSGLGVARFVMSGRGQTRPFAQMNRLEALGFASGPNALNLREADLHYVEPSETAGWVWSSTTGLCFRREAVQLMFDRVPQIDTGTDAYLIRAISSVTGSIVIDRALGVYRMHETNQFTKHPALNNLVSFDKRQLAVMDEKVSREMIACFAAQAGRLAQLLELPDTFVESIDSFSKVGDGLPAPPPHRTYASYFLQEHRTALVEAFGAAIYERWCRRYGRHPGEAKLRAAISAAWRSRGPR